MLSAVVQQPLSVRAMPKHDTVRFLEWPPLETLLVSDRIGQSGAESASSIPSRESRNTLASSHSIETVFSTIKRTLGNGQRARTCYGELRELVLPCAVNNIKQSLKQ